jgi:hypothetical protein
MVSVHDAPPVPPSPEVEAEAPVVAEPTRELRGVRSVGVMRYFTASDGSKLVQMLHSQVVPRRGRRRVPTGFCHAVPWWSPARAICGRLTERMALWPQADFMTQRVEVCPECRATVLADLDAPVFSTARP